MTAAADEAAPTTPPVPTLALPVEEQPVPPFTELDEFELGMLDDDAVADYQAKRKAHYSHRCAVSRSLQARLTASCARR